MVYTFKMSVGDGEQHLAHQATGESHRLTTSFMLSSLPPLALQDIQRSFQI